MSPPGEIDPTAHRTLSRRSTTQSIKSFEEKKKENMLKENKVWKKNTEKYKKNNFSDII